jgi:hypothetical protein
MGLKPSSKVIQVKSITSKEKKDISNFLKGAIYCWCKNRPDEWFAMRDLVGGENSDWTGTPLIRLYKNYIKKGKSHNKAVKEAGKDLGKIAKMLIKKDKRMFLTEVNHVRRYKWDK